MGWQGRFLYHNLQNCHQFRFLSRGFTLSSCHWLKEVKYDRKSIQELENDIKAVQKKIKQLKASYDYPVKPNVHPAGLYIQSRIPKVNFSPGLGSKGAYSLSRGSEFYRQCHADWLAMSDEKQMKFIAQAEMNKRTYADQLKCWRDTFENSNILERLDKLENDLKDFRKTLRVTKKDMAMAIVEAGREYQEDDEIKT